MKQDLASTSKHVQRVGLHTGEYSQVYSIEPGKTYVIEPQGGELPYDMVDQSPQKFYSKVLNQNILKCNVKMRGKLYFAWTFRPLLRILTTVKNKLVDKIAKKMGPQYRKSIEAALEGKEFDEKIKQMMERKSLDLMDDNK